MQCNRHELNAKFPAAGPGGVIAVVIPSYKVTRHILDVIERIGPEVVKIYVVDDKCPDQSGRLVTRECKDQRVVVVYNENNLGVGGAVMAGYRCALKDGAEVIVKIDGDGQMDPSMLLRFTSPILKGLADYTKGNRFYDLTQITQMPKVRLFGNAVLSFMAKFSTGYWGLFDPTNGYTAISARVAAHLPFDKISTRYFFETDILFRLNTLRAVVVDIPMHAHYADEESGLKISKILADFIFKHLRNLFKRIFYNYFLRDMSIASIELVAGLLLIAFGLIFGGYHWADSEVRSIPTPTGIIMLATLPIIIGFQLLLAFLAFDIANAPRRSIGADLPEPLAK
ncbi:glycosyltransferase family 2 protein [Rhodanobacter geophilus]|uniref:Glycosyltransferase family 2 protein n=1 Tax=Rhodanobacter geophilus TaxID=3162488 RepID=A0ABV3QR28_9GAMM